nr:unnamed protein product [Callosobruchus chinensis]
MAPRDSNSIICDNEGERQKELTFAPVSAEELAARECLWYRLFNKYERLSNVALNDCRVMDISESHFLTKDHHGVMSVESVGKKFEKTDRPKLELIYYVEKEFNSPLRLLLLYRSICSDLGEDIAHMYWHKKIKAEMKELRKHLSEKKLVKCIKICSILNKTMMDNIMDMQIKILGNHILEMRKKSAPEHKIGKEIAKLGDLHNVARRKIRVLRKAMIPSYLCYKETDRSCSMERERYAIL